jgi:hypothetical protein
MLKHISTLVLLSFILLIFAHQAQMTLSYVDAMHSALNSKLSYIFSTSPVGNTTQEATCLLIIPFALVGLPALVYWLVKRTLIPYFYHMVWAIWIILFTSLILTR